MPNLLSIRTNSAATQAIRNIHKFQGKLASSIEKISSGLRINKAADDAAGLSIGSRIEADAQSLRQAMQNTNDAISLVQTAEGAITEQINILVRMREIMVQASNDTYGSDERGYMTAELQQLRKSYNQIANKTNFNHQDLLNQTTTLSFRIGKDGNVDNKIDLDLSDINTTASSDGFSNLVSVFSKIEAGTALSSSTSASSSFSRVDLVLTDISSHRSVLGALHNRLDSVLSGSSSEYVNMKASQSRIMDVDYATESSHIARYQIQLQASVASLVQAKRIPQELISLLG
jgi:flagellin